MCVDCGDGVVCDARRNTASTKSFEGTKSSTNSRGTERSEYRARCDTLSIPGLVREMVQGAWCSKQSLSPVGGVGPGIEQMVYNVCGLW